MPAFTALVHTRNDALRLGRTLEMLLPCSEIVIVDHHSTDATLRVAREYGAHIVMANNSLTPAIYLEFARHHWIFCIQPGESINENLQCSLFEWNLKPHDEVAGYAYWVFTREQRPQENWIRSPEPEVRLIQRNWSCWSGNLPVAATLKPNEDRSGASRAVLEGELLRFARP